MTISIIKKISIVENRKVHMTSDLSKTIREATLNVTETILNVGAAILNVSKEY